MNPKDRSVTDVLRLPELDDGSVPAARLVRRGVSITLYMLVSVVTIGIVASSMVTMRVAVDGSGLLEPLRVVPVRSPVAGRINQLYVRSGEPVRGGDRLLSLDATEINLLIQQLDRRIEVASLALQRDSLAVPLDVERAQQELDRARARQISARANAVDQLALRGIGGDVDGLLTTHQPGSHVAMDRIVAELRLVELDVRGAETQRRRADLAHYQLREAAAGIGLLRQELSAAEYRRSQLELTSPSDGVVITDRMELLTTATVQAGEQLLEIADVHDWRVVLQVSEHDVHRVRVGDRVAIEVPALQTLSRAQLEGSVMLVSFAPSNEMSALGAPGLYRVVVSLSQEPPANQLVTAFRRGYRVRAQIITRTATVLTLIRDYVRSRFDGRMR